MQSEQRTKRNQNAKMKASKLSIFIKVHKVYTFVKTPHNLEPPNLH